MSIITYKLMHLLGIFALLVALAGMATHAAAGHSKEDNTSYRSLLAFHGIGAKDFHDGSDVARFQAFTGRRFYDRYHVAEDWVSPLNHRPSYPILTVYSKLRVGENLRHCE